MACRDPCRGPAPYHGPACYSPRARCYRAVRYRAKLGHDPIHAVPVRDRYEDSRAPFAPAHDPHADFRAQRLLARVLARLRAHCWAYLSR
jgi:hypothetical protein